MPHVQLFDGLASAGPIDLKRADGMCFSRVVYNRGPRIFEVDTRTAMRRMTADFARLFVQVGARPAPSQSVSLVLFLLASPTTLRDHRRLCPMSTTCPVSAGA